MQIRALASGEPLPLPLLLLADPSEELILSYIQQSHTFVAEKAGTIVGVLALQPQGQMAEIRNVAVDTQHQGQGIGRKLVEFAIAQARQQRIKQLLVCTGNSSIPALALYQRCGFRVESIDKDYFLRTYPEPIFENGLPCTDRIKLRLELHPQP
ncbi:GNAT family N-acetyltransferase [Pontibacter chinhatensis]|uniref:Acetyltransferase (GNAT) domain-containing protein n=1 Tax=Pontibacter chinhatensis TaxID=1436961 RepID=A0A1I2U0R4_9BACT|nr:GNAT family N-acetyltransferase [Pontibacter chinhatensis]SFG70583.1 Acetyltransferase (GNAT) domain-containing protein [Pontibacter chinhatensis]